MSYDNKLNNRNTNFMNISYFVMFSLSVIGFFLSNTQFIGFSRDYENYKLIFSGQEPGVVLEFFYRVLMLFTRNYEYIILIVSLLAMLIKLRFLARYTKNNQALLVFLIYYASIAVWLLDYTQFRNGLCVSVLMFSMYYLFNKQLGLYYLAVCLAITAHWSALPFLLLYPYVHSKNIRLLGNIIGIALILIFLMGYSEGLILSIREYGLGQKIGNDDHVNLINSLSLTFVAWYILSMMVIESKVRGLYRYFFSFAILQYTIFVLFSLPVLAFRVLEMYLFLMLTIDIFINKDKPGLLPLLGKIIIIIYLAFYYHVLFGVVNG